MTSSAKSSNPFAPAPAPAPAQPQTGASLDALNKQQAALGAAEAKKSFQSAHTPSTMKRGK